MKFALSVIATVALGMSASAKADAWPAEPWSFNDTYGGPHSGGPYFVAGYGDDNLGHPRRYWGGPYWITCPGRYPPFDTYRPPNCHSKVITMAIREHRSIRVRLK